MKKSSIIVIIIIILMIFLSFIGNSCGNAPGYGNTSKCTICGRTATHKTSNYGFCDNHWKNAIS